MMRAKKWTRLAITAAVITTAVIALNASPGRAGTDADLRAGVYTDESAFALGGGVLTNLSGTSNWFFNPNLEAAFADHSNMVTLNADFHYDFPTTGPMSFYMGAGPAILMRHPDGGDTHTDAGLNLIGGVAGLQGQVRPFAQVKGVVADNSELALMGGIRF